MLVVICGLLLDIVSVLCKNGALERRIHTMLRKLSEVKKESPAFTPKWDRVDENQVYENPQFCSIQAVVICKDDGTPLYDQVVVVEPVGAVTIPVNLEGKIGLQTVFRPVILAEGIDPYVAPGNLAINPSDLGRVSIEVPRGFPIKGEKPGETAFREASEELQKLVISAKQIGEVNPNTAYFVHSTPVFLVEVDSTRLTDIPPDVNEKIFKVDWFSREEVEALVREGKIFCGFTLAVLNLAFQQFNK